ncbi:hypothetical protein AGOR_G00251080 [Albula goreensis]|uniref:phosphatidylinositol-3,5-bisphosphate 3-phosphatase n=1 Tax=Albula goreensis TaxID=1534307 RepID=A0A8T3CBW1_9TELE|nr:hypothetical protein AGOR_G00251080 [Albula goreensis]
MGARDEEGQQIAAQPKHTCPRKPPVLEEDSLQVPFLELHGEVTQYVGRAEDAVIAMSSYRLHIKFKESVVNVPLMLIESVECRDLLQLHITCKDCKVIRCQFSAVEQCQEWVKRLTGVVRPPSRLEDLFSFAFHACSVDVSTGEKEQHGDICRPGDHVTSRFRSEVERMGFDTQGVWRISEINSKYRLCSSYPQLLLVPGWITDAELENVAAFRSWKRFPAVVYRHQSTGAVIARCGQPEVSWWGWRNADDERLVQSIAKACAADRSPRTHALNGTATRQHANGTIPHEHTNGGIAGELTNGNGNHSNGNVTHQHTNGTPLSNGDFEGSGSRGVEGDLPQKLLILDARSYAAAVANRAKGGGCECPEYYPNCEVVFMSMANIHSIRKSFQALRFLCTQMPDPANWLSALEGTRWLQHLSLLLKAALLVVTAVDRDRRPVLVHCSDGWDRTPQIVALSKLLLDPYYRTMEGFQVLVETEWLDLWLDCVHQLHRQFPCSFQFNESFLVKLVQHTYSCLFGTFLCNSGKERDEGHVQDRTCSVWSLLRPSNSTFRNILYSAHSETVLHPVCHVRNLMLWSAVYLPSSLPTTPSDDSCAPYPEPEELHLGRLPKTRSFENLPSEIGGAPTPNRRSSDPNLNEAWQERHCSLELSVGAGPERGRSDDLEGGVANDSQGQPTAEEKEMEDEGTTSECCHLLREEEADQVPANEKDMGAGPPVVECVVEAELSVAVGVAEEQMEDILQEATEDEETRTEEEVVARGNTNEERDVSEEAIAYPECSSEPPLAPPTDTPAPLPLESPEAQVCEGQVDQVKQVEQLEGSLDIKGSSEGPVDPHLPCTAVRTITNGHGGNAASLSGVSMDTTMEEEEEELGNSKWPAELAPPDQSLRNGETQGPQHANANGERSPPGPQHANANGEQSSPIRQASAAGDRGSPSSPKLAPHPWGPARCPCCAPPSQDGLALHRDAVQQRLRQMEAGHQLQVDTLKRQVQELWSRLESRHTAGGGSHGNGDQGDEASSGPDSDGSADPPCVALRSTDQLFSEASWEQVEQQDAEVTRWYPDHLASQCYGCENRFWLETRNHHCRGKQPVEEAWNCGNVFCASCCEQRVPVPSRACKACHSGLRLSALPPVDLELEKPITASSN